MIRTSDGTVYCPHCEEHIGIVEEFDIKEIQECCNCYKNFTIEYFTILITNKVKRYKSY